MDVVCGMRKMVAATVSLPDPDVGCHSKKKFQFFGKVVNKSYPVI